MYIKTLNHKILLHSEYNNITVTIIIWMKAMLIEDFFYANQPTNREKNIPKLMR